MKKILSLALCGLLILSHMGALASANGESATKIYSFIVAKDDSGVPLYSSPDADSEVKERYGISTAIQILSAASDGWYYVSVNGVKGYVQEKYVSITTTSAESKMGKVSIPNGKLNIRSEMSVEAGIVGRVDKGSTVNVLKEEDGWCFVEVAGIQGYVMSEYLNIK